jgi:hypothetical protein
MSLRPGLLWLTLSLALTIKSLARNNIYFYNFACPVRCLRVPSEIRVPHVEDHWCGILIDYKM